MEQQNKLKNRYCLYDIARGLAIITVVLGHLIPSNFIYLFHMPFFIALSGFFYKDKYNESINSFLYFLVTKFKRLIIPFIFYTIIFELLHNFFINIHVYELSDNLQYYHSIWDILINAISHIEDLFRTGWFLFVLFFIAILFAMISYLLKKICLNSELYRLIVVLLLLQLGFYMSFHTWSKFLQIGTICSALVSFYIGYLFSKIQNIKNFFNFKNFLFAFIIFLAFDILLKKIILIGANQYYNSGLLILLFIISFLFEVSIASFIKSMKIEKLISYIGQNTMPILCLHFTAFKFVSYIYILLSGVSIINLSKSAHYFIEKCTKNMGGGCCYLLYT